MNNLPYLLLAHAGTLMLLLAVLLRPSAFRVWIFIITGGAISLGDLVVTGILHLYEYKPGYLTGREDNYLGVLLSEMWFVPCYYTFLSLAPRRFRTYVMVASFIPMILLEYLFLALDVYEHHGWTITYTALLFLAFSLATAYGLSSLETRSYTKIHRAVFTGAIVYYAMNLWGLLPFGILRLTSIRMNLLDHPELDLVFSSLLLHAVPFTLIGLTGIWKGWILRPLPAAAAAGFFSLWLLLLQALGVWHSDTYWNPLLEGVAIILVHVCLALLERWVRRNLSHSPAI